MGKGTVNIHGREYRTVALRVDDFRKKHPIDDGWAIITTATFIDDLVRVVAQIVSPTGVTVATGIAEEKRGSTQINRTSALENCETSAIGRALAAAGYGGEEYASADEVANAIAQQRETVDAPPYQVDTRRPGTTVTTGDPPSVDLEAIVVNTLTPPPDATNQHRFETAVVELLNRGAAALAVTNEVGDPWLEMNKRLAHTLGAHGVESAAEITKRPAQMSFYRDLEDTVKQLEEAADGIAEAGL